MRKRKEPTETTETSDTPETTEPTQQQKQDAAIAMLRKTYGTGVLMRLGEQNRADVSALTTGVPTVDIATGIGGIPRGRVTEVFGPESGGKTTLCLHLIANCQKAGGKAAIIDAEHALDIQWAKRLGVNTDDLLINQPSCGEEALTVAHTLIAANFLDLIIIDSVAALVPKAELEGEIGMATMGMQARLMSQALRKMTGTISKTKTACIFTNQLREKVGVMFGNPETTPGGKALKFYASVRIRISAGETEKNGEQIVGRMSKFKVVKNKVAPPYQEATALLRFDQGFDKYHNIIEAGIDTKVLAKKGAWIQYNGELIGQGKDATAANLKATPELFDRIVAAVREAALAKWAVIPTPPPTPEDEGVDPEAETPPQTDQETQPTPTP